MGKLALSLCFFILSFQSFSQINEKQEMIFKNANDLYEKGEFAKAVSVYESLFKTGVKTSALYCNLANAHFKSGNSGRAILFLEKARYVSPLDLEIFRNLQMVSGAKIGTENASFIEKETLELLLMEMVQKGWFLGSILLLISASVFLIQSLKINHSKTKGLKSVSFNIGAIGSLVLLLCLVGYFYLKPSANAFIVLKDVSGYIGPSKLAKPAGALKEGENVKQLNYYQGWCKVRSANGEEAWIKQEVLGRIGD